jgi:hypothetical protein
MCGIRLLGGTTERRFNDGGAPTGFEPVFQ